MFMASVVDRSRKLQALREAIDEGMADLEAGRVVPWDLKEFLQQAHAQAIIRSK
jgi:predicted transcriptional regulator